MAVTPHKKKQSSIVDLQENPNEESAVYNNIPTMIWLCKFTIANFDIENSHQINTNYCLRVITNHQN